jgi:TRAP-type C4-dicarboxylate transport system permease small subunit
VGAPEARGRRWLDIVATLVTLAFLVPLAWMVWVKVAGTGTQGTMDLRMPLWMFYSVAAVGTSVAVLLAACASCCSGAGDEPRCGTSRWNRGAA